MPAVVFLFSSFFLLSVKGLITFHVCLSVHNSGLQRKPNRLSTDSDSVSWCARLWNRVSAEWATGSDWPVETQLSENMDASTRRGGRCCLATGGWIDDDSSCCMPFNFAAETQPKRKKNSLDGSCVDCLCYRSQYRMTSFAA